MNRIVATMDDLPELPFEKVLSYLSLEDRLKSRAVSRRWYHKINSFRVKSLCYSERPCGFIWGKSRLIDGAFVQNFLSSTRFSSFFNAYGQTILCNLKHLRLCDLRPEMDQAALTQALQSFGQLEELDIIRFNRSAAEGRSAFRCQKFELSLPMLQSLWLEEAFEIELTLNAPRLKKMKLGGCSPLALDLVHGESVERLIIRNMDYVKLKQLKNLKYLHVRYLLHEIDSTFLSGLAQLGEVHLYDRDRAVELFDQKRRNNRADLQVYLDGFLLNGPDDPAIFRSDDPAVCSGFLAFHYYYGAINDMFFKLAANPSRLADEMPFYTDLYYSSIERAATGSEMNVLKRFSELDQISVVRPVPDSADAFQRFLDILKNLKIPKLSFSNQQQDLFDRLPEYCAIQKLAIYDQVADLRFLFRLKHLIELTIHSSLDPELIRKLFAELQFLLSLSSGRAKEKFSIDLCQSTGCSAKQFKVYAAGKSTTVNDLNSAIQFIECQVNK